MEKSDAYLIGRFLGKVPIGVYLVAGAVLMYAVFSPDQPTANTSQKPTSQEATKAPAPTSMCARERVERMEQYEAHMQAGNPLLAANTIRRCAQLLEDAELSAMTEKAEVEAWKFIAKNSKESTHSRLSAIDKILRVQTLPSEPSLTALRTRLEAQLKREKAALEKAEAARKKNEGVTLGMTHEEVTASSWGKPKRVNTSIYSFGTHEQWVYEGSNYLYFRNGKLHSIQTGQ